MENKKRVPFEERVDQCLRRLVKEALERSREGQTSEQIGRYVESRLVSNIRHRVNTIIALGMEVGAVCKSSPSTFSLKSSISHVDSKVDNGPNHRDMTCPICCAWATLRVPRGFWKCPKPKMRSPKPRMRSSKPRRCTFKPRRRCHKRRKRVRGSPRIKKRRRKVKKRPKCCGKKYRSSRIVRKYIPGYFEEEKEVFCESTS